MTESVIFLILAVLSVMAGMGVVLARNPIYSALSLLVLMLSLAGVFLQLLAPFLAVMQLVVYAGAVVVLFVFVILLMNLDRSEMGEERDVWHKVIAFFLAAFMGVFLIWAVDRSQRAEGLPVRFPPRVEAAAAAAPVLRAPGAGSLVDSEHGAVPRDFGSTRAVGGALFEPYLLPFELISILIVIAVVGAVVLSKRKLD